MAGGRRLSLPILKELDELVGGAGLLKIFQVIRRQVEGEMVPLDKTLDRYFGDAGIEQVQDSIHVKGLGEQGSAEGEEQGNERQERPFHSDSIVYPFRHA